MKTVAKLRYIPSEWRLPLSTEQLNKQTCHDHHHSNAECHLFYISIVKCFTKLLLSLSSSSSPRPHSCRPSVHARLMRKWENRFHVIRVHTKSFKIWLSNEHLPLRGGKNNITTVDRHAVAGACVRLYFSSCMKNVKNLLKGFVFRLWPCIANVPIWTWQSLWLPERCRRCWLWVCDHRSIIFYTIIILLFILTVRIFLHFFSPIWHSVAKPTKVYLRSTKRFI